MRGINKKGFKIFFKILVLILLFWLLFKQIDVSEAASNVETIGAPIILLALSTGLVAFVPRAMMWNALLGPFCDVGIKDTIKIEASVTFINQSLPSRAPILFASPLLQERFLDNISIANGIGVTVVQVMYFAVYYSLFSLVGLLFFFEYLTGYVGIAILLSILAYVSIAILLWISIHKSFRNGRLFLASIPLVKRYVEKLINEVGQSKNYSKSILGGGFLLRYGVYWISVFIFIRGIRILLLFEGVNYDASLSMIFLLPTLAYSVTILPISIGGLGIAELSATLVLAALGVPINIAASVVLLDRLLGSYLPNLLGAFFLRNI